MDSQIIAEVAIVDCRAFVAVVFSTSPGTKVADGFSYILNGVQFCCGVCSNCLLGGPFTRARIIRGTGAK